MKNVACNYSEKRPPASKNADYKRVAIDQLHKVEEHSRGIRVDLYDYVKELSCSLNLQNGILFIIAVLTLIELILSR